MCPISSLKALSVYMPTVDGKFLQEAPSVLLARRKFDSILTMMGTTTNELVNSIPIYDGMGTDSALLALEAQMYPYVSYSIFQQLMTSYPNTKFQNIGPPLSGAEWSRAVAIQNDLSTLCPMYDQALAMSGSPTWKFRWNSVLQSAPVNQWEGVPQGSEIPYVYPKTPQSIAFQDQHLADDFQRRIINFVEYFDPNALSDSLGVKWPLFTPGSQPRMVFQCPDAGGLGVHVEDHDTYISACDFI